MNVITMNETHNAARIFPNEATSNSQVSFGKLRATSQSPKHDGMLDAIEQKKALKPPIGKVSVIKKHPSPTKIKTLGHYDILCGRSSTAFNNIGNRRFRMTISFNLKRYMDAPTRSDKSVVIWSIVKLLKEDVGARFVKASKGGYVELTEKKMREKVGHALRDMQMAEQKASEQKPVYEAWAERALQANLGNLHVMFHEPSSSSTPNSAPAVSAMSTSSIIATTVRRAASETEVSTARDYYSADDDISSDGSWDPLPLATSSNEAVKANDNSSRFEAGEADIGQNDDDSSAHDPLVWGISSRHSV